MTTFGLEFSPDAREYAATVSPRVILIDGERLAELMIDYNVGVTAREAYEVKRGRPRLLRRRRLTGDRPERPSYLRIEERELDGAGGLN